MSVCLILRGDFSIIAGVRGHSLLHHLKLVGMKGISECISKLLRTSWKRRSDETNRSYSALPCRRFSLTEIRTATNNFDDNLFIGCCGDWKVYNGFIDDPVRSVAISRVNIESMQGFHEFRTELLVLCQVRHPNFVPFIGYCLTKRYGFLVYEFMANSNLARHLNGTNPDPNPNPNPIPWKRRLKICVGVARGLHYLHTGLKHTIVHSGVDPTNILLDAKWEAKLSYLGLSKMGPPSLSKALITIETDRVVGTYGYMDQEYVMFGKLNDKSDVYSFGVVLLQLLSGITPSPFAGPMDLVGLARKCKREGTINKIIDPYLMGKIAPDCFKIYVDIATSCVRNEGKDRPTIGEVEVGLDMLCSCNRAQMLRERTVWINIIIPLLNIFPVLRLLRNLFQIYIARTHKLNCPWTPA